MDAMIQPHFRTGIGIEKSNTIGKSFTSQCKKAYINGNGREITPERREGGIAI